MMARGYNKRGRHLRRAYVGKPQRDWSSASTKIGQIDDKKCNHYSRDPETQHVAHIVSGDRLPGARCRYHRL